MDQANLAKPHEKRTVSLLSTYAIETPERREQERTRIKKKLVLELLAVSKGVVMTTCDKAEISTWTYYQWLKDDADFAKAVEEIAAQKNNIAADILWGKITLEKDGPSVRYYLDRKHPEYKPKAQVETVITGDKTLEDLIDEEEAKQKNGTTKSTGQPGPNREDAPHPEQAPAAGAVPAQPSAGVVLEKADPPKPDTKG